MNYFTSGKEYFQAVKMPLVYTDGLVVPDPESPYYGLVFIGEGILDITDSRGKTSMLGPLVLFLKPGHSVAMLEADVPGPRSLIFRPEAINNCIPTTFPITKITAVPEFFFFRTFAEIPETGYAAKIFPQELRVKMNELCARIDENLNSAQTHFWPCLTRSFFLELLILLERNDFLSDGAPVLKIPETRGLPGRVFTYIHTRYNENISLDDIAARFATNRTTLNSLIRKSCGMSIIALLRNTDLSVAMIANNTGFLDEAYFSRTFRKKKGIPPSSYRKSFPDPYSSPSTLT
jgi:AraC-like DNA-binding protein